jgi:flagellar hook-basal body complex protein FliE
MQVDPISSVPGLSSLGATPQPSLDAPAATPGGVDFGEVLGGLQGIEQEGNQGLAEIAIGAESDLHDVVLAAELESLSFDLAVQIRNRLVEAYQEIFRMSV